MDASVGKALREARLKKGLTIEEAARATKIRVDRLSDLEKDEYTSFPNLAYARGFAILYAKFLGVDPSKYQLIDSGNPLALKDYQYLQNDPGLTVPIHHRRPISPERRSRWLLALAVLLGALLAAVLTTFLVLNLLRLGSIDQLLEGKNPGEAGAAAEATPSPSPSPEPTPEPTPGPPPAAVEPLSEETAPWSEPMRFGLEETAPSSVEEAALLSAEETPEPTPEAETTPEPTPEATPPPATPAATPRRASRPRSSPAPTVRRATRPTATPGRRSSNTR